MSEVFHSLQDQFSRLNNGVVLAELGGYGDGPYCARHGAGSALVMLGTYIVDQRDDVPYPPSFVFKPGRAQYATYLREHVAAARASQADIGVSVVSVEIADTVDFLVAAEEAGADYASLCAHSTMEMFVSAGVSSALCRRENWDHLRQWASAIVEAVHIPVIFKIGLHDTPDTVGAVDVIAEAGVPIVHVNVEDTGPGSDGLAMIDTLRDKARILVAGGGIRDVSDAERVLEAGADAVAIGTAAMKDAELCRRIQKLLPGGKRV